MEKRVHTHINTSGDAIIAFKPDPMPSPLALGLENSRKTVHGVLDGFVRPGGSSYSAVFKKTSIEGDHVCKQFGSSASGGASFVGLQPSPHAIGLETGRKISSFSDDLQGVGDTSYSAAFGKNNIEGDHVCEQFGSSASGSESFVGLKPSSHAIGLETSRKESCFSDDLRGVRDTSYCAVFRKITLKATMCVSSSVTVPLGANRLLV
jgi:hypothetical protein